jgi:amino acid transporter
MSMTWRRVLFGTPLPTARAKHERLPKILALPVFASDALSSVAYATEEILLVLALAGAGVALNHVIPLSLGIAILLGIVAFSYRQTIHAYPNGGGSYIVAKDNLGTVAGLTAAAALLIDYVLTVSVSIAAGVEALTSAYPHLKAFQVALCIFFIIFVTVANLRGARESGMLFAIPTYTFVLSMLALIVVGIYRYKSGAPALAAPRPPLTGAAAGVTLFLLLRAFASGCTAMTGVEAVSNGVPAFRPPESKNASSTLVWMAVILGVMFVGVSYLSHAYNIYPNPQHHEKEGTVVSMIAETVVGRNWFYFLLQYATAGILVLAANTSYADFPRLGSLLARDTFLPRQLSNIGDRLVFSNGIVLLAVLSSTLVWVFHGVTSNLIPLYAIGVFLSFTLSQAGMVKHWLVLREPGWKKSAVINGMGALATGVVLLVIAATKFMLGAWIVVILIPMLVLMFLRIRSHYLDVARRLSLENYPAPTAFHHTVCVLVPKVHRGVIPAIAYARSITEDVRGVYVEIDPQESARVHEKWARWAPDIPLVVLDSPYRALIEPIMSYLDEVERERPDDVVTVVIPEFVAKRWWEKLLHNHSGLMLKFALLRQPRIVVTNVRYYLDDCPQVMEATHPPPHASETAPTTPTTLRSPKHEGV